MRWKRLGSLGAKEADPIRSALLTDIEASKSLKAGAAHRRAFVGPPVQYDFMGATQFRLLASLGLREDHSVLDLGCGSLRAGRLLIQYLLPDRYFGIEPNMWLVEEAIEREVGRDVQALKNPRFSNDESFDMSVFGIQFDFVVAQSIFSHTGQDLFDRALVSLAATLKSGGQALITCIEPIDVAGTARSDEMSLAAAHGWIYPECVVIDVASVLRAAGTVGLHAQKLPWYHPRQTWYRLTHSDAESLSQAELALLTGAVLRDDRFPLFSAAALGDEPTGR